MLCCVVSKNYCLSQARVNSGALHPADPSGSIKQTTELKLLIGASVFCLEDVKLEQLVAVSNTAWGQACLEMKPTQTGRGRDEEKEMSNITGAGG